MTVCAVVDRDIGPVAETSPSARLRPGLFGKLPGYGDFVRRGWPDETVSAIDRWLSDTMRRVREGRDDAAFARWMRQAPLWRGYVPPGCLGPRALHLGIAPSIDSAGRLFPFVAGVSGDADTVWAHAEQAGQAIDSVVYRALAGEAGDADVILAAIPDAAAPSRRAPDRSAWWLLPDGEPVLESDAVDAGLLRRLWGEGQG